MILRILVVWLLLTGACFGDRVSWKAKQETRYAARLAKRAYKPVNPWLEVERQIQSYNNDTRIMHQRNYLYVAPDAYYYDGWHGFYWGVILW
jgi:hypothetical protein